MSRTYDEREVAEILRRATTHSDGTAVATKSSRDLMSLEEIKEVAAEAGIEPSSIEAAANSLGAPAMRSRLDAFVGTPINIRFEAEYPIPLDEEGQAELVRLVRATLGRQGVVGGRGDDLEWADQDGFGGRYVNAYSTRDGTRIEIMGRFKEAGSGLVGVMGVTGVVGAIAASMAVAAGPLGLLAVPAAVGAMYAVPRLTIGSAIRREKQRLSDLSDRVRQMFDAHGRRDASARFTDASDVPDDNS